MQTMMRFRLVFTLAVAQTPSDPFGAPSPAPLPRHPINKASSECEQVEHVQLGLPSGSRALSLARINIQDFFNCTLELPSRLFSSRKSLRKDQAALLSLDAARKGALAQQRTGKVGYSVACASHEKDSCSLRISLLAALDIPSSEGGVGCLRKASWRRMDRDLNGAISLVIPYPPDQDA